MEKENNVKTFLSKGEEIMSAPTSPEEVEWKVQTSPKSSDKQGKYWAIYVPYVDARALQKRLTKAYQSMWSKITEHLGNNQYRTTIYIGSPDAPFISRDGMADGSDIEKTKGGESNSFKRAGVMFGFGTDLYSYPKIYVEMKQSANKFWPVAYPNKLNPSFRQITEMILAGLVSEEDVIYIESKDAVIHKKEYGKRVEINAPKKRAKVEETTDRGFSMTYIRKHMYNNNGKLTESNEENAMQNWLTNCQQFFFERYIYVIRKDTGSQLWFLLTEQQKETFTNALNKKYGK